MEEIDDTVQKLLVESHENLDRLDRDLVAVEREPGSRDLSGSLVVVGGVVLPDRRDLGPDVA